MSGQVAVRCLCFVLLPPIPPQYPRGLMPHRLPRRTPIFAAALIALLGACADQPLAPQSSAPSLNVASAATTTGSIATHGVQVYPYEGLTYIGCARDGQGDYLQLSGEVTF